MKADFPGANAAYNQQLQVHGGLVDEDMLKGACSLCFTSSLVILGCLGHNTMDWPPAALLAIKQRGEMQNNSAN